MQLIWLSNISALDPAGYLFTKPTEIPARRRLNATDFKVTKAIYTDKKGLGSAKPMAAINIYANKGEDQPNCDLDILPIGGQILPDVEVDMFPCRFVFYLFLSTKLCFF